VEWPAVMAGLEAQPRPLWVRLVARVLSMATPAATAVTEARAATAIHPAAAAQVEQAQMFPTAMPVQMAF
jgi:hypothetical protein